MASEHGIDMQGTMPGVGGYMTALNLSLPQRLSTSGVHINPYKIGSYKPLRGFVGNPKMAWQQHIAPAMSAKAYI